MARDTLGEFELEVLQVLIALRDGAYGVPIRAELERRLKREVSVGAAYTTLDRLQAKGYVRSWEGEATPERGGRRKKFFAIEADGVQAVRRTEAAWMARVGPQLAGA